MGGKIELLEEEISKLSNQFNEMQEFLGKYHSIETLEPNIVDFVEGDTEINKNSEKSPYKFEGNFENVDHIIKNYTGIDWQTFSKNHETKIILKNKLTEDEMILSKTDSEPIYQKDVPFFESIMYIILFHFNLRAGNFQKFKAKMGIILMPMIFLAIFYFIPTAKAETNQNVTDNANTYYQAILNWTTCTIFTSSALISGFLICHKWIKFQQSKVGFLNAFCYSLRLTVPLISVILVESAFEGKINEQSRSNLNVGTIVHVANKWCKEFTGIIMAFTIVIICAVIARVEKTKLYIGTILLVGLGQSKASQLTELKDGLLFSTWGRHL